MTDSSKSVSLRVSTPQRRLQVEFSAVVQRVTDATGRELLSEDIYKIFEQEYLRATTYRVLRSVSGCIRAS